jgi:hypothetical protein
VTPRPSASTRADHADAFAAYEQAAREFVELNQALAISGGAAVAPRTEEDLALRNKAIRSAQDSSLGSGDAGRIANSALNPPNY